ncbi:MAG: hypothetical protein HC878_03165 [Leptolyngbyaceae cyanobacterium SL_5_14]|nr:hypothetical protein [Leptolyngbyaceae cyanobacterium SL_5_14]
MVKNSSVVVGNVREAVGNVREAVGNVREAVGNVREAVGNDFRLVTRRWFGSDGLEAPASSASKEPLHCSSGWELSPSSQEAGASPTALQVGANGRLPLQRFVSYASENCCKSPLNRETSDPVPFFFKAG